MAKKTNVHKKVEGQWYVECRTDGLGTFLSVKKIIDGSEESLLYRIYDNESITRNINAPWYGKASRHFTHEELMSVHWPTYLTKGESENITVLPSGNFYVE